MLKNRYLVVILLALAASPAPFSRPAGCDLNGDGRVDIVDVQSAINKVLTSQGPDVDLNGDGVEDVVDVQATINVVLGAPCPVSGATTSTTTTTLFVTSTTTSSSTTTGVSTTTTSSSTTTTTLAGGACNLYGDEFTDGDATDWGFANGTWQAVGGRLRVNGIPGDAVAIAEHGLPAPNFFRLLVDFDAINFNGTFYGLAPFSSSQTFNLQLAGGTVMTDGVGAAVFRDNDGVLKGAFLVFDLTANQFVVIDAQDYGTITGLGVLWEATGVTLLVNGTAQNRLAAASFGQPVLATPTLDLVQLYATGDMTDMGFDNVCQSRLSTTLADSAVSAELIPSDRNRSAAVGKGQNPMVAKRRSR